MAISKLKATFLTIICSVIIVSLQDLLIFSKSFIKLNIYIAALVFLLLVYGLILVPMVFSVYDVKEENKEYNEARFKASLSTLILTFSTSSLLIGMPKDYFTIIFLTSLIILSFICMAWNLLCLNKYNY